MTTMSITDAREALADTVNRVAYRGERVVLCRHDKQMAALIPIEDLELLERLQEAEEERIDAAAIEEARAEQGDDAPEDWADVKARLRLKG